jgi:hypothetical protein
MNKSSSPMILSSLQNEQIIVTNDTLFPAAPQIIITNDTFFPAAPQTTKSSSITSTTALYSPQVTPFYQEYCLTSSL